MGIKKNPLIKIKNKEISVKSLELKKVKGEYLPFINLFSYYNKIDDKFFPEEDKEYGIGIQITLPIFTGFSTWFKKQNVTAELAKLRWEKQALILKIKQDILSAYKMWQSSNKKYQASEAWLKSLEADYKIVKEKYKEGLASVIDVTSVMAKLSQARAKTIEAKYESLLNYYKLIKTMGYIPVLESPY